MSDTRRSLRDLEQTNDFVRRHIGPSESEIQVMLGEIGIESLDALADKVVPRGIRNSGPLALDDSTTEAAALAELRGMADQNVINKSWIGLGYYGCHVPTVILRNVLENPGWYTAYTPYQPEISQGRLEAILNFQTMFCDLTGLELANASMLDEGTAAAEAMTLCQRQSRNKSNVFFVSQDCFPQTIDVVRTRAEPIGIRVVVGDHRSDLVGLDCFGALLQYPAAGGEVHDYRSLVDAVHEKDGMVVVAADILSLTLLASPGELGADVAVGSTQRFGVPMMFGGPHAAFFATRDAYKRSVPGRLVGVSVDSRGDTAYRLALQTREQHIRREKATSNICTAQALLAIMASMYAVYHGPDGLKTIAQRVHRLTATLVEGLRRGGIVVLNETFFDTVVVNSGDTTAEIHERANGRRMNLCRIDSARVGISLDETATRSDVEDLWSIFGVQQDFVEIEAAAEDAIPAALRRTSAFLTHAVFNSHHSETEMLRYLRALMDKDLALDRAMIPLGSCTMKLNATSELIPVTWPEFADIHPFAPREQTLGYRQMMEQLEAMLCACTGYDAVSLQPNAGSQGEYAGLLAINAYHESRGDAERNVCLIPSSAHGTNPASANMVGMKVVVVNCDADGNVDVADLRTKAAKHADTLAAIMITYPSTHGVFESAIEEICAIVHDHGGQVYLDGANLNAQVGLAAPGKYGSDVSHLNLHKTFCIPHGGGGPGVGPIGVRKHLAPFMPGHRLLDEEDSPRKGGPVCSAPFGSAGILPITWAYIRLMGRQGILDATRVAILNANYLARKLGAHYPVLYTGPNGMVAHECIIDLRDIKDATGITVDDVAKRLIDYGFHAPTMSFPVAGTLMIEPTESESKQELDRFVEAMVHIREEIRAVECGDVDPSNNPLKHAPHTAADLADGEWNHPYSRAQAVFPVDKLRACKYWVPVGRVDNVYGDRNLVCSCPAIDDYRDVA